MNNGKWILLGILIFSGCATTEVIYNNYTKMVDVSDGVDEQEAKIIAQKQIVDTQEKRHYRISLPDIKTTQEALKYPGYWFILFGHNWFSPISTDSTAKTYTNLRETQYLVVINKQDGEVIFSGEWFPKRSGNFDWVFDREDYKKSTPLALPPGEESKKLY